MVVKDSSIEPVRLDKEIKSIAIIGGGASGAIALDSVLKENPNLQNVIVFERRDRLGGVWTVDSEYGETRIKPGSTERDLDPILSVPSFEAGQSYTIRPRNRQERFEKAPAIHKTLRTNIPERVMTYTDDNRFPFLDKPEQDELTTLPSVGQYIDTFLRRNLHHQNVQLRLNSYVEKITKDQETDQFAIVLREELKQKSKDGEDQDKWYTANFDAVIVATGHYSVPYLPEVDGLEEVIGKYPELIVHARGFLAKPEIHSGKKIIVVGGRASAIDSVRELYRAGAKEVIWSVKEVDFEKQNEIRPRTFRKPKIVNYEVTESGLIVHFEDGSTVENPDKILYATGYQFSFPFLTEFDPKITYKSIVPNVYQHTFHLETPRLSFIGIPMNGMSFRVFEYQAILVAKFLAGKVDLPSLEDQIAWRDARLKQRGYVRLQYHNTAPDPALSYIETLVNLGGGYDKEDGGKKFPKFTEEELKVYEANRENLHSKWELL